MSTPTPEAPATRPAGPVTLQQVAERAGVSSATASRALHGSNGTRIVGEELRRRVLDAARELRYVSNAPAQALARSTTAVVGVVVHDVADPYFAAIAAGAMGVAREHGLLVMLAATFRDPELELDYIARLRAQRARAIVLAGSGFADREFTRRLAVEVDAYRADGGHVVSVGAHGIAADTVRPGNRAGAALAVRHLYELGHRRFGIVSGPRALTTVRDRLDGARRQLRSLGVALPPGQIVDGGFTREDARVAVRELLARAPEVTAIVVLNDVMAAGVLAGLRDDLGLRVPERISVVGFDDLPFAVDLHPALSTVRLPLAEIGAGAMRMILAGPAVEPRSLDLDAELVVRSSSAGVA
ncbi:LacI family DNA-binding transcriptional regulator [Embleya sp. NBC_00896]|uniref:LacI family DNA-binding transcriptional regulator n=1 Tax=Embleya sp. NBC_00896 TaxID=2975961 RepID=UPI002F919652|nr:LacI family transcriptional regulator [Embleya sp. NBC_00896]